MPTSKEQVILPVHQTSPTTKKSERFQDEDFKKMIRSMNLKVTDQRMLILRSLYDADRKVGERHVTAQELYEKVITKDDSIGFATVYRFLRDLASAELVTEVRVGGQPARYELTPKNHHDHLTCTHCGKICEFENPKIEELQLQVAQFFGFKLTGHVLELYGTCSDCLKKGKS